MTKLLDPSAVCSSKTGFPIESLTGGRLNPRLILKFDGSDIASMSIESDGEDDESNDLRDAVESMNSLGASISLDEFRRRHGLK